MDSRGIPVSVRFRGVPLLLRIRGGGGPRRRYFLDAGFLPAEAFIVGGALGVGLIGARLGGLIPNGWIGVVATLAGVWLVVAGVVAYASVLSARNADPALFGSVFSKRDGQGQCRACRFPLEGLPVEDDGCVVCPECGAAWRVGSADG